MIQGTGSDVIIMLSAPTGNVPIDRMNQYIAIHRQIAYARGIPIIDLYEFFGSYDAAVANKTTWPTARNAAEVAIIGPALLSLLG